MCSIWCGRTLTHHQGWCPTNTDASSSMEIMQDVKKNKQCLFKGEALSVVVQRKLHQPKIQRTENLSGETLTYWRSCLELWGKVPRCRPRKTRLNHCVKHLDMDIKKGVIFLTAIPAPARLLSCQKQSCPLIVGISCRCPAAILAFCHPSFSCPS